MFENAQVNILMQPTLGRYVDEIPGTNGAALLGQGTTVSVHNM
jgi:hypothetical protein